MAYKIEDFGKLAQRRNYSKIDSSLALPPLVEIQTSSFDWFLKEGLREVYADIYPIKNHNSNLVLDFVDFKFEKPKYNTRECKERDATYAAPLAVTLRLQNNETGEVNEQEVFMGDFPLMTQSGTFIINGAERVIVSQLVRSPGAYFKKENEGGKVNYLASLIPSRGTWLEIETGVYKDKEKEDKLYANVRIDRTKKMPITILLRALGLTNGADTLAFFGDSEILENTINDKDTVEQIDRGYVEIISKLYADREDKSIQANEGLSLLQSTYFNSDNIHLSDYYKEVTNDNEAELLPLQQLVNIVSAGGFKHVNDKNLRIILNVLENRFNDVATVLNRDTIDELRKELLDLLKELKDGKTIRASDNVQLLVTIYFENKLQSFIKSGRIQVSDLLKQELVNLDYLFGFETFKNMYDNKPTIDESNFNKFDINHLSSEIKTAFALIEIYEKLKPGEPATLEGAVSLLAAKFFDNKRYDLTKAGRFKLGKKLNVMDRLFEKTIAEDIIDVNGDVIVEKGTFISKEIYNRIRPAMEAGANMVEVPTNLELYREEDMISKPTRVQKVAIYVDNEEKRIVNIIGTDTTSDNKYVTISDMLATVSYLLTFIDGIGDEDDIDHLGNRRIKSVGELIQNQCRIGLSRMERVVKDKMSTIDIAEATPKKLTNNRPFTASIKEFFASSQLSQFMDQTNPLAELANKRRLSALGPGGLARDRAGMEVRDVHHSHYGRMCPIETPEGPNIGLINSLATYAKINMYGFIETPYLKVVDNFVTDEVHYLTADEEYNYAIAQANIDLSADREIIDEHVVARFRGENKMERKELIDFIDVSPKQIVSVATSCIPFLENDDANRALMGANMQRQAVPLLKPTSPIVGTGMEHVIAKDSGVAVICEEDGIVKYIDARSIIVSTNKGDMKYILDKFTISNQGTCFDQNPIVRIGETVNKGQILANGPAMDKGELALGQNVVVAFMTWNGYNYEDAIIMSERLVKEDVYTSIHIDEYTIECRDTKLGPEEITRDIPNISDDARKDLDIDGIIRIGAEVKEGDILVGKVTPKGQSELSAEEKLLLAIFGEKSREVKDNSLRVPHGGAGIILDIKRFTKENSDELPPAVNEVIRVYVAQKRKISEGDKMAGRHGNKGIISKILPIEDMPYLPDGTPVDIMLNPLGVPSRMNIGQLMEVHLGMAAKLLGVKVATPVFDGVTEANLEEIIAEAGMDEDAKTELYDGQTGKKFDEKISVGVMYMIKLAHMVDDKLHARSVGPYSLVTQQPLGGKAQNGGQRFGEMEVWALEAYGAAHTLQEILTVKSDDVIGRVKTYEAIVKGNKIPEPGIPESFRVLQKELQSLAIDVKMLDDTYQEIDMKEQSKIDSQFEQSFRSIMNDESNIDKNVIVKESMLEEEDNPSLDGMPEDDTYEIKAENELENEVQAIDLERE
ncbi:DNA-directed RNA polymerase subunit beta [Mycoplasma sp. P36-A1]|uniref:DNA-directed RNA polymerase subunit beta n=1 Tax=Mycoplasma sp. P36-A1 TaxID=3252900 RepID=UPI003C2D7938